MSELCRFHGIIIRIYSREHEPAHHHAVCADHQVPIGIAPLD